LYLIATVIAAPVAFRVGLAEGRWTYTPSGPGPFVVAAPDRRAAGGTTDFWDCDQTIRLPALRIFDRVQDCRPEARGTGKAGPYGDYRRTRGVARPHGGRKAAGPLDRAVLRTIAGGPEEPTLLAANMAALASPYADVFPSFGGGTAPALGRPALPGAFAVPVNLLPGLFAEADPEPPGFDPDDPPTEPPAPEVPAPAALPLLLTGAGLLAFLRRRRKS
jgi:hypothetical protein